MAAYYNEFNPKAAHMLIHLIADGLIAPGDVDNRPIQEVRPDDLKGYTQCHFFAGIGGWSVALRLAGYSDDKPVWTGSCPCQPFSTAGRRKGYSDERHLWPHWFRLIKSVKPSVVYGEQVASAIAHGWWDDVATDLEAEGYSCGAAVLPACSVGKPHKRDRLWFVANSNVPQCKAEWIPGGIQTEHDTTGFDSSDVAYASGIRQQGSGCDGKSIYSEEDCSGQTNRAESDLQWLQCPDGKTRAVKSGICIVAHGVQHRAPILHALGNAIVPQLAAEFIRATQ
jgi:DNA (cytosine-5)-methyltransferase 1